MSITCQIIPAGILQANCVIVADDVAKKAIVVDPGGDADLIFSYLKTHDLQLESVWLTHGHYDHLAGLADFPEQNVPLYLSEADWSLLSHIATQAEQFGFPALKITWQPSPPPPTCQLFGGLAELNILPTPGHTNGSISLFLKDKNLLIVGDTIFAGGGVGRTDLPGGNYHLLRDSIEKVLFKFADNCQIISGHGAMSTIGREKSFAHYYI